ncbi:hypothetical protein N7539_001151 [Penicillium diatomitis]|uniref:Uncharacterized protein n=1 Tax=Penicillium diatomitis TaxID=2819901 RepID=A0A9W9XNW3_9EURO|nr:uncharacterized protein N7539_001151 [Penicillium diatomitis]KAJ5496035.1 hypothetical protein N7539_001151 [Penicillium diatomitis]
MATAYGSTTHLSTGPLSTTTPTGADESKEYERILQISDDIFAGTHPRLKVPQQFVRKPASRNIPNGSPALSVAKKGPSENKVEGAAPAEVARLDQSMRTPVQIKASTQSTLNAAAPPFQVASKPTSEIDPILLTKSEDLVRAEMQLQRQRVERTLRDQLEQRKQESKQKPAIQDTQPEFDVSAVLDRALEIVRPVSLSGSSEQNVQNESFDENSFYSSRAPDSPRPVGELRRPSSVAPPLATSAPTQDVAETYEDELQRLEALNRTESDQEMRDAYPVVDQSTHHPRKHLALTQRPAAGLECRERSPGASDEPEYSPPSPMAPPLPDHDRYAYQTHTSSAIESPSTQVQVVRNHITSPAAPQPSHVSRVSTTKFSSAQQRRMGQPASASGLSRVYSDPESGREGVSAGVPSISSRKRRKIQASGGEQIVTSKNQATGSFDVPIKVEPVSPPPFADDPAVPSNRQPRERPVYIDIASPRYSPAGERREPPVRGPVHDANRYLEYAADHGTQRSISRVDERHAARADPGLRRVVATQYVRQPDHPSGYGSTDPRGSRAASYAVVERVPHESLRYYDEMPASHGTRYMAVDEGRQSTYQEPYYEEAAPVRLIRAPERRFVVDEFGNRYEMVPAPSVQSMAPPPRPMSRALRTDGYQEPVPSRTVSVRAASVVQDQYGEHRYVQEMPPPPPTYRRVVSDYVRPVETERRVFTGPMEIHDPYVPGETVPIPEYAPRQSAYAEEHGPPRERVIRTSSVRPQAARYEEPLEVVQRVSSVHPGVASREVSVFADERPRAQYVERPYYIRDRRYHEAEDANHVALDGHADSVPRLQPRY